jgi:hypothetical protein
MFRNSPRENPIEEILLLTRYPLAKRIYCIPVLRTWRHQILEPILKYNTSIFAAYHVYDGSLASVSCG